MKRCLSCEARFAAEDWTCPSCGRAPASCNGIRTFAPELASGTGIDAEYRFDALETAGGTHFWFRSREAIILWAIRRYLPEIRSALEVGCGTGSVAGAIRRA